jgi:hypothetical protein
MSPTGDKDIFPEQKIQEFSYNSSDDLGVLWVVLPRTITLIIDHSYI